MKKQFYVSISMLPKNKITEVRYRKESRGEIFSDPYHFPALPMLDWNIFDDDDVEIIAVMTDDDNGNSANNFELFQEEMKKVSENVGRKLRIDKTIVLPHREDREKQIEMFKKVCATFREESEIYMDITYGTKITSCGLFSALTYAEKVRHCNIKSIFYGKYPYNGATIGEIYDVRCLYEMSALIHAADYFPSEKIDSLLNTLWG